MAIGLFNDERLASDTDALTAERRKQLESFLDAELNKLHLNALASNLVSGPELCEAIYKCISLTATTSNDCESTKAGCHRTSMPIAINTETDGWNYLIKFFIVTIICLLITSPIAYLAEYVLGIRCFLPNNYLIWEATRPISDCSYCKGVNRPIILKNMTQEEFQVRFQDIFFLLSTSIINTFAKFVCVGFTSYSRLFPCLPFQLFLCWCRPSCRYSCNYLPFNSDEVCMFQVSLSMFQRPDLLRRYSVWNLSNSVVMLGTTSVHFYLYSRYIEGHCCSKQHFS